MTEKKMEIDNMENYNKKIKLIDVTSYSNKIIKLLIDFLQYTGENIHIQNREFYLFIIKRGLETLRHVFLFLLMYTKNIDLTLFHCRKSFFYYVEFLAQISDDRHTFLQLSTKDATLFVYKKTIFKISSNTKKNSSLISEEKKALKFISKTLNFFNILILDVFKKKLFLKKKEIVIEKFTSKIKKIFTNFLKIKNNAYDKLKKIIYFSKLLRTSEIDSEKYISILDIFSKKLKKTFIIEKNIKEKFFSEKNNLYIKHYTPLKFVNWIFSN